MGVEVDSEQFDGEGLARFGERLRESLRVLEELLARPGFGHGETTVGAELEVSLVDAVGRPLARNVEVVEAVRDPRVTVEVERFNLECNLPWWPLAGRPFERLERELGDCLALLRRGAAAHGGRIVPIGILPTLVLGDLGMASLTDAVRYRVLNAALVERRGGPFLLSIHGDDDLELETTDVSYEGANTSFQLHLRVEPTSFAAVHNAAQLATAPALAVAGNAPTLLGRRLWEETRIALFKQSVDARDDAQRARHDDPRVSFGRRWVRDGALELFAESVALHEPLLPLLGAEEAEPGPVPELRELRLHQGTVWRWNRAIYDPAGGGHLRIELRTLPSGPTISDMAANAALMLGLTLALARDPEWVEAHPFKLAERSFYAAAREGLAARIDWPGGSRRADLLALELLPVARDGLVAVGGVEPREADRLLAIVEGRVRAGQTGARWQRRALAALEVRLGREEGLRAMLERYLALSEEGAPVHTWPVPAA